MKGEIRIMDKELKKLLNNYVNVIHGKAFPINPTTHQLHLLLDYIANLEQQCKKQKEAIDRLNFIKNRKNQGASQENINKMAIEFVNSWLKEVSK